MLGLLTAVLVASGADAGAPVQRVDVKGLFDGFFRAQGEARKVERQEQLASLKTLAASVTGAQRTVIDRMIRIVEKNEPLEKSVPEVADVVRDLAKLSRGDFDAERATAGAFLSLPGLARVAKLDPEPLRREAMVFIRELVARYPNEARAHGLLASALMDERAESKLILVELKRCSELDSTSWCTDRYSKLVADLERPRCSGAGLKKPLAARGAREADEKESGATITANGRRYVLEAEPILRTEDVASVSVDGNGRLNVEVTTPARGRLDLATRGRVGQTIVLMFGDEVLLAAQVQEPISEGKISVSPGRGKPPFALEQLCRTIETPAAR